MDKEKHCDGYVDCADGSDETSEDCSTFKCFDYEFRCGYGACIRSSNQCDGKLDCRDGSDEAHELCQNKSAAASQAMPGNSDYSKAICD